MAISDILEARFKSAVKRLANGLFTVLDAYAASTETEVDDEIVGELKVTITSALTDVLGITFEPEGDAS